MQDSRKTKAQLIEENAALRRRVAELESQRQQLAVTPPASEEKFRNVIEQASEAIALFDEEAICIEVNAALERLTGIAREEWLGLPAWAISLRSLPPAQRTPEMAARFKAATQAMIATGNVSQHLSPLEYSIQRPEGGARAIRMTIFPIRTARGTMLGSILIDITERKQAEEQIRQLNAELEQRVAERTLELQTVNEELQEDIRQRQRIEEMLRRSEQRYRTLFDSAGDAIFIVDLAGNVLEANRMASQQLGYSHDELKGLPVSHFDASPEVVSVADRIHRLRFQGEQIFEAVYRRRDGSRFPVEIKSAIVEYAGNPAILGIVRDITERKQIEETLRRSEASLAEAQRIAHFGSWIWDLTTNKLQCSDEMFRLVGLRPQEIEITPEVFLKFLPPDSVQGILEKIQKVGAHEPSDGLEHQIVRSTGEIRHVYSRVKVYRDEHGQPLRLLGSTQDITYRKQAEQALQQYADEQSALYEIALRLSAQLNTSELLQLLVEQAVALLGVQSGGLYLHDAQQDKLVLALAIGFFSEYTGVMLRPGEGLVGQAFQTHQVLRVPDYTAWEGQVDLFKNDQRLKAVIAVPLLGKHSVLGVLIMADYADKPPFSGHAARLAELFAAQAAIALENAQLYEQQQEQYHRLQDAQARLIQSEKMSALGRLIASISHEINNPLQAVQGCLTLIREGVEEAMPRLNQVEVAPWLRDLEVASNEVQRIAAIVQRLRDFYRPARPGLQATDIAATIDSVFKLAAKQLQHSHITVEQTIPAEPPIIVNTNTDQFKQIVLNLVLNAIDAMPGGGTLRVTAAPDRLWLDNRAKSVARIDFSDSGQGISLENLPHIFEPFFTTKDTGSGLGLSISYELVKMLGGDLSVVSQVGVGSTFTVRLPFDSGNEPEDTQ
ncbi:MAG TPA: PAS domain S-box protein [Anaerolineae bacterium]|nr:PAS domain S-box protein [Anaerolineae bacterium]